MRFFVALLKFALRIAATIGIGLLATLAFTRIIPANTALNLAQRLAVSVGMFFLVDMIQARVARHVNETVDTVMDAAGYQVTPHPLDKF